MKRRFLSIFLAFTMILLMLPNAAIVTASTNNSPWFGSGTEQDPYRISSRADLLAVADAVNGGNDLLGVHFIQTQDLELGGSAEPWPTIGITIDNAAHQFRGVYDGNNFNVNGLYVDRNDDDAGLFGYVGNDGVIRNVYVEEGYVKGTYWVAGIASRNYGLVEYCGFSGEVYGSQQFVGGIVGDNHSGIVRYCYNLGYVEFDQIGGGVVGRNSGGTIENCYNRGEVTGNNAIRGYAGGVLGENTASGTVDNCYSDGYVNGNMACGSIVGANGESSSVENCYYPSEFEDEGLPPYGSSTGKIENMTGKSEEDFDSGEVAWELSQGKDGSGWGQGIDDENEHHPHFMHEPSRNETPVYRVRFWAEDPEIFPEQSVVFYIDPGLFPFEVPTLSGDAQWYVNGVEYDKNVPVNSDLEVRAGRRALFAGEDGTVVHRITYNPVVQTTSLDSYIRYVQNGPSPDGRFTYTLLSDEDGLGAKVSPDGSTLIIPAGAKVRENGYTLTFNAHEKEPYIVPLAWGPFDIVDITLTVNIVIEKATPAVSVKPDATAVYYGTTLSGSTLSGGAAVHPETDISVKGMFSWSNTAIVPTVNEAAITGYYVTFTPNDTTNYNNASTMVTLTVNKVAPTIIKKPEPINSTYNGMAENLITEGKAEGGTMKYWLADDPNAVPPEDNSAFSSTVPARANAGTYKVWYKVIGDENHTDTAPKCIEASILPYSLKIGEQKVIYNGGNTFTVALDGVKVDGESTPRTVIATLTARSKNAGDYTYSAVAGEGKYTAELSNSNYVVSANSEKLIIKPLPVVLKWTGALTFPYDGLTHTVEAEISNILEGDTYKLKYENNSAITDDYYTAKVIDTGNPNYTLDVSEGAQNVTQPWLIFEPSENIDLFPNPRGSADDPITYGDKLTLTAVITAEDDSISSDTVKFYVNRELVGTAPVIYQSNGIDGTATLVIDNATSQKFFSLGANALRADYYTDNGNNIWIVGIDAVTVFVEPKPITATFVGSTEKTYDGNNIATGLELITTDVEDYDDVKITADNFTYNSSDAAKATKIIANNVTLSGAQSGNYTIANTIETKGTISQRAVKLEWRGSTGLVYNGTAANVNATATEYLPGDECTVEVTNGNEVNAGSHTAEAVGLSNSNYKLPDDDTTVRPYNIAKADLYIPEQDHSYNGTSNFTAEVDGVTLTDGSSEKVKVDLTESNSDVGIYSYSVDGISEENFYTASSKNNNYQIAGGAMLTIEKADPTYTAPDPKKLTYNGEPQELTTGGKANGGKMQYSLSKDGSYSTDIPVGTEIGEYTIWYRIIGDKNHNDIAPQSVKAEITLYVPNTPDSETPSQPSDDPPNTGIDLNIALYLMILCSCGTAITFAFRKAK